MPYEKINWVNKPSHATPLTAANLNHLETQYDLAVADAATAAAAAFIPKFADPNADRISFWDDSVGAFGALAPGTGMSISGTDLNLTAATTSGLGGAQYATDSESQTGTATNRAVTPASLAATLTAVQIPASATLSSSTFTSNKIYKLSPGATYTLASQISLTSSKTNITIDAQGAFIRLSDTAQQTSTDPDRHISLLGSTSNITIMNANFIARPTAANYGGGSSRTVHMDGKDHKLINCRFTNGSPNAVYVTATTAGNGNHIVANNYMDGSGISYANGGVDNVQVLNNTILNAPSNALSGNGNLNSSNYCVGNLIQGNWVYNAARMGIEDIGYTVGTRILDNRVDTTANIGISVPGFGANISRNTVISATGYGIEVANRGHVIAENRVIFAVGATTGIGIIINSEGSANGPEHHGCILSNNYVHGGETGFMTFGTLNKAVIVDGCLFYNTYDTSIITSSGTGPITIRGCSFHYDTTSNATYRDAIAGAAEKMLIEGCYFKFDSTSEGGSGTDYFIRFLADKAIVTNCVFDAGGRSVAPVLGRASGTSASIMLVNNMLAGGASVKTASFDSSCSLIPNMVV